MKRFKLDLRAILKTTFALTLVVFYWYWVNQRIISDTGESFSLVGFFVLMSFSTAFFPLPANIIVLGAVKTSDVLLVSILGGFATLIAYFLEYIVFTLLFKFNRIADVKKSWVYEKVQPLFNRHKFFILAFTSFLPIPSEPLRIYAITRRYPKLLYMFSGFVGRIPRYFLLGYYGKAYVNSVWFIAAVFIFPGVLLLIIKGCYSLVNLVRSRFWPEPVE